VQHPNGCGTPVEIHLGTRPATDTVAELRDFAARDGHLREVGGIVQAAHHLVHHVVVEVVHVDDVGEVGGHETGGNEVVGRHGDEVVAEGVVFVQALGHLNLGPDAVGADAQPFRAEADFVGEAAVEVLGGFAGLAAAVLEGFFRPVVGVARGGVAFFDGVAGGVFGGSGHAIETTTPLLG
jgi:hypothetical protein